MRKLSSFISHHSSLQRKQRFTLIELLIVVAIIAILAGMLLPALNKAKDKGRTILCSSKIKSMGNCYMFYVNDYKEYMLDATYSYRTSTSNEWYLGAKLPSYYNAGRQAEAGSSAGVQARNLALRKSTILSCPVWDKITDNNRYPSYGFNCVYTELTNKIPKHKFGQIKIPSKMMLIGENFKGRTNLGYSYQTDEGEGWDFRHQGFSRANVVFADFHAETRPMRMIPSRCVPSYGAAGWGFAKYEATYFWMDTLNIASASDPFKSLGL